MLASGNYPDAAHIHPLLCNAAFSVHARPWWSALEATTVTLLLLCRAVAETVAELRSENLETICSAAYENADHVFRLNEQH